MVELLYIRRFSGLEKQKTFCRAVVLAHSHGGNGQQCETGNKQSWEGVRLVGIPITMVSLTWVIEEHTECNGGCECQ